MRTYVTIRGFLCNRSKLYMNYLNFPPLNFHFHFSLSDFRAINFADPMKHGFRIILHDEFLKSTLAPNLLPTLYVTAIPMRKEDATVTKMFYPDTIYEDKQVCHTFIFTEEEEW